MNHILYWFDASILAALAFAITQLVVIGRCLMGTQQDVDKLTAQVVAVGEEVKAAAAVLKSELEAVKAQLAAANVPADTVDLTALAAAIEAVDDIHPDVVIEDPAVEEPVEEPAVDEPVVDPVVDPVEEPVVVEEPVEDNPPF